uniref:Cytochrome b-c1 complex subunit 8 n=1 Tax=Aotus nancymaae TaxID=37293 RepID=A0A2K5EA03_AOTNA
MGLEFGNLMWMRHQRPFPHVFSKGIPNVLHRTRKSFLRVVRPFVVFYLIYTWGTQEFERSRRKNPAAYENDK